ncbi:MAG: LysM peptidoglycan-binding domain-containing protein [Treponema sp.]|nr:LysM peptidoglycan-binding domain-containing protein [Treponema sp.]
MSGLVAGAIFSVYFAFTSPELPPDNLFSELDIVAEYYNTPGNFRTHTVTLLPDEDWAVLTTFTGEYETGLGSEVQNRNHDIEYTVRPGETLSGIAYSFGISYEFLAWYNTIANANKIRAGTKIIIPSLENISVAEPRFRQQRGQTRNVTTTTVRSIQIAHESRKNGSALTAQFSIVNPPSNLRSFEWDMGDGKRSLRENPSHDYFDPKTYVVRLTAKDNAGIIYRSNPLYIDIPYPASTVEQNTTRFVTLASMDDYFVLNGSIARVARYAHVGAAPMDLSESDQYLTKVRFKNSGYYGISVVGESGKEQFYSVFVSPIPTMHADFAVNNFNWYRTQHNSGTQSTSGPASASMAIGWGAGRYFPVSSVREAIGWKGDGATSLEDLLEVINGQGIPASIKPFRAVQDIRNIIDSGSIAIILYRIEGVGRTKSNPDSDLFGKYYSDYGGHYVVIKGYSLDGKYFVIHDPIPSDWGHNSFRYGDEISMIGRNRYYSAEEVIKALRRNEMIVVPGQF